MSTLKVTDIKAKDGTSALSIADSTGVVGANKFTDLAGTGAPDFPNGLTLASNATGGNITGVTLDDYEEGTWTPTDASGAGLTFTVNSAKYTKVGNAVHLQSYIIFPSTASGTLIDIGGLPFATSSGDFGTMPLNSNVSGAHVLQIPQSSTNCTIRNQTNDAFSYIQFSSKFIIFSGSYLIS